MNWIALILLALGGIVLTAGDIFMKKWVVSNNIYLYIIGMIVYVVGLNFLAQSFKYKNIAVASVIFVLFNIITLSLVSYFYFKEKISGLEMLGMCLGLASIVLLELAEK
jgi:multidrug transporter EmrE-like cation transporter